MHLSIDAPPYSVTLCFRTISQIQYWQRRQALGVLPFAFFFLALVALLIRVGLISGRELVVDSSRLRAYSHHDPGASWSRCRGKATMFAPVSSATKHALGHSGGNWAGPTI